MAVYKTSRDSAKLENTSTPPVVSDRILSMQCTNSRSRVKILAKFKSGEIDVLGMTYKVGADGLNLQFCSQLLELDAWWSLGVDKASIESSSPMAMARCSLSLVCSMLDLQDHVSFGLVDKKTVRISGMVVTLITVFALQGLPLGTFKQFPDV